MATAEPHSSQGVDFYYYFFFYYLLLHHTHTHISHTDTHKLRILMQQSFWEITWEFCLLIYFTNYGLINTLKLFCHCFFFLSNKILFWNGIKRTLSTQSHTKWSTIWPPSLKNIGLLTGWIAVVPLNQIGDPTIAWKDFMVQIHQRSEHSSIKHDVGPPYNQKLHTLCFQGWLWQSTLD